MALVVKNPPASTGDLRDMGSILGLGKSPGGGHGNPLQYSCLENPWIEEPGRLQSMGSQRVGDDWRDLALMHTILAILSLHDQEISFHFSLIFFDNNLKFSRYTVCAFVNLSEGVLVCCYSFQYYHKWNCYYYFYLGVVCCSSCSYPNTPWFNFLTEFWRWSLGTPAHTFYSITSNPTVYNTCDTVRLQKLSTVQNRNG